MSRLVVLDAGAVERLADERSTVARLGALARRGWTFAIPTVVLAECLRGNASDARANRVIRTFGTIDATQAVARTAAALRHRAVAASPRLPPSGIDAIVAAHAVHLAADAVLTTDRHDLRRLLADQPEISIERP